MQAFGGMNAAEIKAKDWVYNKGVLYVSVFIANNAFEITQQKLTAFVSGAQAMWGEGSLSPDPGKHPSLIS